LKQRSLLLVRLQSDPPTFYLPSLVKAYAVHQFMGQFSSASRIASQARPMSTYAPLAQVINLSPVRSKPVQLSQWFQGQFEEDWRSLDWLFESASRPAMRLRSAYHLRDETFLKRCKAVVFETAADSASAILLVAIHQDADSAFKVCVQAQPAKGENSLPHQLDLRLLDAQRSVLATVSAEESDTFIQLPYFRGEVAETFEIELALSDNTHTETFVI